MSGQLTWVDVSWMTKMEPRAPARLPVETGNNQSEHRMWDGGRWPLDTAKENVIGKGQ